MSSLINRIQKREIDISGFVSVKTSEIGAMVIDSTIGRGDVPLYNTSETDIITNYYNPSAAKFGVFEALNYVRQAPIWLISAIGSGALYAGIDIETSSVSAFGSRTGRSSLTPTYSSITKNGIQTIGTGDGIVDSYVDTLTGTPITDGSLQIKNGGTQVDAVDSGGVITGTALDSGTINLITGALNLNFAGTPGTVADYTTKVDISAPIDISGDATSGTQDLSFTASIVGTAVPAIPTNTYSLNVNLDGGGAADVTFSVNVANDWSTIVAAISTAIVGGSASISGGKIVFSSDSVGSASSIVVADGTTGAGGGFLTALAVAGYSTTLGTSVSGKNAGFKIKIDNGSYVDVDLGSTTISQAGLLGAINTAVGDTVASVSTNFVLIEGLIGDADLGGIDIDVSDNLGDCITTVIDASATVFPVTEDTASTSPTGSIPKYGQAVSVDYIYTVDASTTVSHSFFASSQYNDADYQLAMDIAYTTGTQYEYTLYRIISGAYTEIESGTYSLTSGEKDNFGKSVYIDDVFNNHTYVIPYVNSAYVGTATPTATQVNFTGGNRGATPTTGNFTTAWNKFQQVSNYPVNIYMDAYGNSATTVQTLLNTYNEYAFGITTTDLANDGSLAEILAFKSGLGINYDNMAVYCNWEKIRDTYNDSYAWTSGIGKVGRKFAQMEDVYDALSPAGIDENDHGGLLTGFQTIEMNNDFSPSELTTLDQNQINPKVFDSEEGPMIVGDRTLQTSLSDTSFIGTRRLYNLIIKTIVNQVLKKQIFKLNDVPHRRRARSLTEDILRPIIADGLLREALVVCDETNNTDAVLNAREFVLDVYVKVTPNSQTVKLNFIRLSQSQVIAELLAA